MTHEAGFVCRSGCAACCIAPSISSAIPGMPKGKPAGVACVQLDPAGLCQLFGHPSRPEVCLAFTPSLKICGESNTQALHIINHLEYITNPDN
ncbi:MAG: YkgJ family cysteine cluster protein [Gammaproteobacteria bacterium]|nr:YkgJ family cysteine cluster protein [Gammaproteobacteria bacterium]